MTHNDEIKRCIGLIASSFVHLCRGLCGSLQVSAMPLCDKLRSCAFSFGLVTKLSQSSQKEHWAAEHKKNCAAVKANCQWLHAISLR
jgi:hypothetical protein